MKTMRADPLKYLGDEIDELRAKNLYRPLRVMSGPQAVHTVVDGRPVISLSSNNYLGLTTHPHLVDAADKAVRELGVGTGAVRTIAGDTSLLQELERRLADFKHVEAVLTLQSGPDRQQRHDPGHDRATSDLIVSDELNHASIIDGVRLSRAARTVFPHRDVDGLEKVLREARASGGPNGPYRAILVITDGVFSMDGDIAPLPGICEVADRYEAAVMVDDAHASGVLGRNGRGTVDHFDLHGRVDIQVGTLSKAIGVMGGYIAGRPASEGLPDPALPDAALLDVAAAGRRRRVHRRDRRARERARADRAPVGQHALLQGGAASSSASTRASARRRSRRSSPATRRRRSSSPRACSSVASSPRPSSSPRSRWARRACARS